MHKIKVFLSNRSNLANILMASFVILTAVGAGIIFPPAGLIIAGVCCGLVGLLLGLE
jgi:hypothetical protein